MKKIIFSMLFFSLFACSSQEKVNEENTSENPSEEGVDKNIIDPTNFDFSKSLDPIVLFESMNVYFSKELQLVVYPLAYMDKEAFRDDQPCSPNANSDERKIYLKFKEVPSKEYTKNQGFIVKGKVYSLNYDNTLSLSDVEIVSELKSEKPITFEPAKINEKNLYKADDILKSMLAWGGKEVTVVGDYLSTTVSKSVDGKQIYEIRVDLGVENSYDHVVGCAFDQDLGDKLKPGMKNVKIKGVLDSQLHFNRPYLTKSVVK